MCAVAALPIFSEAGEVSLKNDLIALTANFQEILLYETPSLSEDGKKIAWTVRKKPPEAYFDSAQVKTSSTPFLYVGSKILMKEEGDDPLEISVHGGNSWGPSWSLDGNYIAYYSDVDGQKNLWVYDVAHKTNKKVSAIPVGGSWLTTKIVWGSNNKEIYITAPSVSEKANTPSTAAFFSHFKSEEKSPTDNDLGGNRIVAINVNDGTYRSLIEKDTSSICSSVTLSPSGNWIASLTSRCNYDPSLNVHGTISDIGVVSADGKKQLSISQSLCRDFKYKIQYLWHPSLDRLYFIDKKQILVAEFTKENLVTCKPLQEITESIDTSTLAFTKDGKYLVVGTDSQEMYDYTVEHPTKLLLIPLDQTKPKSYALPQEWVFTGLISNKKQIVWQPSPHCIAFTAIDKRDSSIKSILLLNLSTGDVSILWKGQAYLKPIDFDQNHLMLYMLYQDFTTNRDIFRYHYQDSSFEKLSNTEEAFSRLDVGHFHLITSLVPGNEGKLEELMTGIILPAGTKQGDKLPAVVIHYPGANLAPGVSQFGGGDAIGGLPQWLLTNHGFAVILPNLVMGKEGIGKPLQVMTDRLIPQVIQAANLGYIDINRVGIMGQSYGGYGTAGIISHTDIFRAAIATNGIYDLASLSYHLGPRGQNLWITWAELSQGNMGLPLFDDPKRYIDNSPFYRADKIHTPILFIHGQMDDAYTDVGKMFSALRRLNRSAEIVIYHKGDHVIGSMRRDDHINAIERVLNYFQHHLAL